ncbi:RILP-like protein 1 isoform X2 [Hypomesus transpacificus]|uniref:RILP-like protein 1 isoform X2 n=1 Tax=Hypomesus transpacificus TaxID=137520 RepID=UPI001F078316|nr:RILP-like protein 1 isoform X2 [Hypomesus transpacificus]
MELLTIPGDMEVFGSALHKNATELTVMDVYDIAAVVGNEFERIIDQYGCEALSRLMPKVVRVLEVLEVLVSRSNINPETEELRCELDRLRLERNERLEKEKKHQKELEQVEDVWRGEAQDLLSQIAQLQADNKSLLMSLSHKDSPVIKEELQKPEGMSDRERQVMRKLREVVDKQRDDIRAKDHELALKTEDVEALQLQQHRLMKINQDLRRRIGALEVQGKTVIQQKAELEALIQARQQEVGVLRREVERLREERVGWEMERERAEKVEASIPKPDVKAPTARSATEALCDEPREECEGQDRAENDAPRFTLQELRDVLQERNELKAQVFVLQEELAYYKSEDLEEEVEPVIFFPSPEPQAASVDQPESGIKRLIFTAIMPMVAAGLIQDDPTLMPIRRLMSFV